MRSKHIPLLAIKYTLHSIELVIVSKACIYGREYVLFVAIYLTIIQRMLHKKGIALITNNKFYT